MSNEARTYVEDARRDKLERLRELGTPPFAYSYDRSHSTTDAIAEFSDGTEVEVSVAGRVVSLRRHGKTTFAHLEDASGALQIYFKQEDLPAEAYETVGLLDIGDFIGVSGSLFRTRTEEITLRSQQVTLLAKAVLPLPFGKTDSEGEEHGRLEDSETRHRLRYVDLAVRPEVRELFRTRARVIAGLRSVLDERGYVEVETPVLQPIYGGAMARPFTTHQRTLDSTLYLRIATELYLKRLIVGGMEKVYEIGKDFRNEGVDRLHNPEFTMLEFYEAYADYTDMMELTELLISTVTQDICGSAVIERFDTTFDFTRPWVRQTFSDLIETHAGVDVANSSPDVLRDAIIARGEDPEAAAKTPPTKLIDEVFRVYVEPVLIQPTFVVDYPIELSPLAKPKRGNDKLAERFELFVNGSELANAFSELNDPDEQRERFEAQVAARKLGDREAQQMDEDYIRALECGLPPTGGCGIGIDRLVMLLTAQTSIRDVILFPMLRPEE